MKTYQRVYERLLTKANFTTGEQLACDLGISRTAIWKAIQTLEKKGLVIESVKKRGYRLISGDLLSPYAISQALHMPVYYKEDSLSTQLDAKKGIETAASVPALYLAPSQSAAKGRFERSFFAGKTGGIYMSLHLKPNCHYPDLPPYTLMAASCLVKAIQRLTGIDTQIKWVNDIYLDQKKVAGILTEAISSVETGLITDIIIGIGINFAITEFPKELTGKVTSLFPEGQSAITRDQLIIEIWRLFQDIPQADLIKVYKEKSLVLDRQVSFMDNQKQISGKATAISDRGELEITFPDGSKRWLSSGEVSLTSW
ncbi:bifunctional biotin--[acetyl-CoA-carboxylase] ligase/biotin operon repressor BirA [Streptococcus dentiloxodontae]